MEKPDMSCARVVQYQSSGIGSAERHNERKNESYDNINVEIERIPYNVHYKDTGGLSYMDTLRKLEADSKVSLRGLRQDATLFDEIIIDVNTMYFEKNGGYKYAKQFYKEAFRFIEKKFGSEYVISAVMHADELNRAASDELGKPVYHYHLHAMVLPVVEKEILWSKRCKDPKLRGTVKEVVHQISHSKKWASDIPMINHDGKIIYRKNGKPKFRPSYSILQDELFKHLRENGFDNIQRGELGSTSEHLTSLQYQMDKDKARLEKIQKALQAEKMKYKPAHDVYLNAKEVEAMGQKTLTGKISMTKEDFKKITALAQEGLTSREKIRSLSKSVEYYRNSYVKAASSLDRVQKLYDDLREKCKPFLLATEHFPDLVQRFVEAEKRMFVAKEERERQEKATRDAERKLKQKTRKSRDNWSR